MRGRGRPPGARMVVAGTLTLMLGGACTGSEPAALPTASPATPNPTPASPPPPPASPTPTGAVLEDGRHFGYVNSVDLVGVPQTLVLDLAEFLRGEAANEAAREDGMI